MGAGQSQVLEDQHVNKELCTSQLSLVRGCTGLFNRAAIKRQSCSGDQKRLCFVENEIIKTTLKGFLMVNGMSQSAGFCILLLLRAESLHGYR